jgi:hypothetical protein
MEEFSLCRLWLQCYRIQLLQLHCCIRVCRQRRRCVATDLRTTILLDAVEFKRYNIGQISESNQLDILISKAINTNYSGNVDDSFSVPC